MTGCAKSQHGPHQHRKTTENMYNFPFATSHFYLSFVAILDLRNFVFLRQFFRETYLNISQTLTNRKVALTMEDYQNLVPYVYDTFYMMM